MYDLGNRLAPVLQLGEEFAETKPPPPSGELKTTLGDTVHKRSSVSTMSDITSDTSGDRKLSLKVDKTTPVL